MITAVSSRAHSMSTYIHVDAKPELFVWEEKRERLENPEKSALETFQWIFHEFSAESASLLERLYIYVCRLERDGNLLASDSAAVQMF